MCKGGNNLPKPDEQAPEEPASDGATATAPQIGEPVAEPGTGQNDPSSQGWNNGIRNAAFVGSAGAAAGAVAPAVATAGLSAAGFGSGGIIAGSFAAGIQGPAVAATSWFATFQSIGATGGFAILGPVGIGAAVVGAGITGCWLYYRSGNPKDLAHVDDQDLNDNRAGDAGADPIEKVEVPEELQEEEYSFPLAYIILAIILSLYLVYLEITRFA